MIARPVPQVLRVAATTIVAAFAIVACSGTTDDTTTASPASSSATVAQTRCDDPAGLVSPGRLDVVVADVARTATVHLPAGVPGDQPLPVVLSFHGVNGTPALQQTTDGLDAIADREGFVVVRPEGLRVGLNDRVRDITGWDPDGDQVDEAAFVATLLDELGAAVCVDRSRVYATGFSAGAYVAWTVACARPDRIAAVATVGGAYQTTDCAAEQPLALLAFHGLDDVVTPFAGRSSEQAGTFAPVLDVLRAQADRNGCTAEPEEQEVSATVRSATWTGCERPTVLYQLDDHGHAWPGRPLPFAPEVLESVLAGGGGQPADPLTVAIGETPASMARNVLLTNVDVDASELIWEFFASQEQSAAD